MPFLFEVAFGSAMLICAVCLFVGLMSSIQDGRLFKRAVPLTATLCSFAWVIVAFKWHGAFGPDYSKLRYSIIGINIFGMLLAAIAAAAIPSQRSWPTVPAAAILSCTWLYIGAINSVAG
jgi:hypothetical protein